MILRRPAAPSPGVVLLAVLLAACRAEGERPSAPVPDVFAEGADQVMVEAENYVTRDGVRRAFVEADTALTYENEGRLDLRGVRMTFFTETGDTTGVLTGRRAEYALPTGDVTVRGDVVFRFGTGERMTAPMLAYSASGHEVRADSGYVLTYPDGTVDRGSWVVRDLQTEETRYGPGSTTTPEVVVPQ
ncbi:MAG: hypothetical protein RRA92_01030 [Gemmatimonadota bacterium]|nr:hypothetical protein [Gemmatimonadota bacterium]